MFYKPGFFFLPVYIYVYLCGSIIFTPTYFNNYATLFEYYYFDVFQRIWKLQLIVIENAYNIST